LIFGPLGTLQNVAVISWMQSTPVPGPLWLLDCCWPVVGAPVVTFASWLFVVAFAGVVCAWALGDVSATDAKIGAAIKASLFMGSLVSAAD
jgi:hypothetical protein